MPTKPPTPCTYPGCPNLARRGSRCPEHTYDRMRGSAARRGYDRQWRKVRLVVLERDRGVCQECGAPHARQVAHIVDRRAGGSDDPANLRLLCDSCHSRETARETGFGRPVTREPRPTDQKGFSVQKCKGATPLNHRTRAILPRREIPEFFPQGALAGLGKAETRLWSGFAAITGTLVPGG